MRKFVYGDDVVILAWKGDGYYPFACVETCEVELLTELLESSAPGSGAWEDYEPSGRNSWTAKMGGVMVLEDDIDTLWYSWELFLQQVRSNGLDLKFAWKDKEGNEKYATGKAYIPSSSMIGTAADFGRWLATLQGTGPLDLNGVLIENIDMGSLRIELIATGAEPNKFQHNKLIGLNVADIYEVSWEGDDKWKVITGGVPTAKQVRLDNVTGELIFLNNFEVNDFIWALIKKV